MVVLDRQDSDSGGAPDDGLRDADLQAEIELVADLVLAASVSDSPLSTADIDRVLGVVPAVVPGVATPVPGGSPTS